MTPRPPARTPLKLFDARHATGTLLLLTGSLSLGLTTLWLDRSAHATQAQTATQPDTTDTWASAPAQDGWQASDDWTQAAPQGSFDSQPAQSARGWSRGS